MDALQRIANDAIEAAIEAIKGMSFWEWLKLGRTLVSSATATNSTATVTKAL